MATNETVASRFGEEIADRLARWAIDIACYPPADIATYATRVPATWIAEGRSILDDAGIDWRALKGGDRRSRIGAQRNPS